jgi:hypothetical protein
VGVMVNYTPDYAAHYDLDGVMVADHARVELVRQ